jgi:hypothetical protein
MGGTCGDLVSAVIDNNDVSFNNNAISISAERSKLKKPHLFADDNEKDQYLLNAGRLYKSIPSHDADYHINRGHDFIGIVVNDKDIALWAAERFKRLHRPHVWDEMINKCGANSVEGYAEMMIHFSRMISMHTIKLIDLADIKQGNLIDKLSQYTDYDLNTSLYSNWIKLQN